MANILIVDDSIVMRKNLSTILKRGGHNIVGEASNGRQAILQYNSLNPDIVTMDITMPIMDGVEAVKRIISEHKNAKIIMVSAVNQKQMVFTALNNGATHYIVKPIESEKLLNIISEITNSSSTKEYVDTPENNIQGFEIDNLNGVFTVKFNEHLSVKDHSLLSTAIKGLLFIKPLKIEFDFGNIEDIDLNILEHILNLAGEIKSVDGSINFKSNSQKLLSKIESWEK